MAEPGVTKGDKFTWTYVLWFLPLLVKGWVWWLAPRLDWWIIDFVIFLLLLLAVVGSLCLNLVLRRWRRALSLLLAPILLLVPMRILATIGVTPDNVRFALTKQAYLEEINRIDVHSGVNRFKTFAWNHTFEDKTYWTLVYDESDEIALPISEQSSAWRQRIQVCSEKKDCIRLNPGPDEFITVTKIDGHFYLVGENFPNAFP